jgi:hypothetical protein
LAEDANSDADECRPYFFRYVSASGVEYRYPETHSFNAFRQSSSSSPLCKPNKIPTGYRRAGVYS